MGDNQPMMANHDAGMRPLGLVVDDDPSLRLYMGAAQQIKALNFSIALDDFGTGYSSLSYLTSFPVDVIKIDRSFVMGCTTEPKKLIIIKAIIAMGHSMDKRIVAEGIETEEQLSLMKELNCDEGQGFFLNTLFPKRILPHFWRKNTYNT